VNAAWITVAGLTIGGLLIKASGPLLLGQRSPSERALAVIALLAPAVLTSLVVYQTFGGHPTGITVDARVAGLAAAALALAARLPIIAVIFVASVVTALARALV
jgi:hypothetical protein